MNQLSSARRSAVVAALCEGMSLRTTVRVTGVAKNTVTKLIAKLGAACSKYQDDQIRNVLVRRLQCDEIWSFVGSKGKHIEKKSHGCDYWTWTALDVDSKLILSFWFGHRSLMTAYDFMYDVTDRLANRTQLTTDGQRVYIQAVESAVNPDMDTVLRKIYGAEPKAMDDMKRITGNADRIHVSASFAERVNPTMRISMRRFTGTSSKKLEHQAAMVALFFMYYNFARVHQKLGVTPAMKAGISDHVWPIEEIVAVLA